MSTKPQSKVFEVEVFERIQAAVATGKLGFNPKNTKVFLNKRYPSRDRNGFVETDVSVELWRENTTSPTIIWIWECKDLKRPVIVTHLEVLHAKLEEIGADNTKGTLICRGTLTKQALEYAKAKRLGVARLYDEYIANVASYTAYNEWRENVVMAEAALNRLQEHLDDVIQDNEPSDLSMDVAVCTASGLTCFGYLPDGVRSVGGTLTSYLLGLFIGTVAEGLQRERRQNK